jgi:hypothetical protein
MPNAEASERTIHDRIFKEYLRRFLPQFLRGFSPDVAAHLDLSHYTPLDQELLSNFPNQKLRIVDFVAEVKTIGGEDEIILVHIEVEARKLDTLPRRMFEYYALLRSLRQKRVLPIALVLIPNSGGLTWQIYEEELFGHELVSFHYGQVGLADLPAVDYAVHPDPALAALSALMNYKDNNPAEIKLSTIQKVGGSDLTIGDKLFLINVVGTYMPTDELQDSGGEIMPMLREVEVMWLDEAMEKGLEQGLEQGIEQGLEQGIEQGREEERREIIQSLLGVLDEDLISRIIGVPVEEIAAMKEKQA